MNYAGTTGTVPALTAIIYQQKREIAEQKEEIARLNRRIQDTRETKAANKRAAEISRKQWEWMDRN